MSSPDDDLGPDPDETAAHEAVYGHPASRREEILGQAFPLLAQMVSRILDGFLPNGSAGPVPPVPGKIDCLDCQGHLSDLRAAVAGLEQHLEIAHDFWPHEQFGVFQDAHKSIAQVGRVLRYTRHIERIQGDVDPYALVRETEPDTTGTPANTRERLAAVLDREGPGPLYDPATDDLEPAEPRLHAVVDDAPGAFLDGGGDAAPEPADAAEPLPV